jgi:hypothetical protein
MFQYRDKSECVCTQASSPFDGHAIGSTWLGFDEHGEVVAGNHENETSKWLTAF